MQPEVTHYYIISETTWALLVNNINKNLKNGYTPLGGVSTVYNSKLDTTLFSQALVKYKQPQHKELT